VLPALAHELFFAGEQQMLFNMRPTIFQS